ncbi:MAG: hypothetical protein C4K49_10550 [Candidatus Thorarchaeota archaeon]|nr:MAG: hypothetical protein C4K49_10550 [Candidatus Thorarchaeota archaeon]
MAISTYSRTPAFSIEVVRPDYTQAQSYKEDLIVVFGMSGNSGQSTACISYEFQELTASLEGSFSFTTTLERDSQGKTWYDKIKSRDLVRISEHGKVRFVGYLADKRYIARMAERGPERSILFSGKSIGSFLVTFSIILDLHILSASTTAQTAQTKFMEAIAANVDTGQQMAAVIVAIKDAYFEMMEAIGGNQNLGVKHIIDSMFDFSTRMSTSLTAQYPIAISAFQTQENNLWDTISQVLNPPFHELYGMWDPDAKKYQIWLRQTPFDASDWMNLPIFKIPDDIPALLLVDYDVGASDADVKTFFVCTLPGSGISREKALTLDSYSRSAVVDDTKWPYYGFRPMYVECRFFSRSEENQKNFSGAEQLMHDLSQKLYDWYSNNADFLTGTVTIMSVEDNTYKAYPRIGERLGFLGGEFYIEATKSSWQYEGQMTRSLSVSRGYMYTATGSQREPIQQVGPKIGVLEQGAANG